MTDPYTADRFDFNPLKSATGLKYQNPITKTLYTLNFCGGNSVFGDNGTASRQVPGEGTLSLGNINQRVELSNRQLSMTFLNGAPCDGAGPGANDKWSLVVLFVCDPDANPGGVDEQLSLIREDASQCIVSMRYRTPAACYTGTVANCKVWGSSLESCGQSLVYLVTPAFL